MWDLLLKTLLSLLQHCFCFYVLVFWPWGMLDLSFLTKDRTCTPCSGRQRPNHWTTREAINDTSVSTCIIIMFVPISTPLWRRKWHLTPVLFTGKSHGRRSLVGYSRWDCEQLDTTERLHLHFSLSCIGERNANPLQYSCLENPRNGGAWWAAVYGVAQSRTRLKWLSSSSSIHLTNFKS